MSHFTVMVIGPDIEKALQPFHEFECTGTDDEFVQNINITERARNDFNECERKESFAEYVSDWHGVKALAEDAEPDLADVHKYGWVRVNAAGEVLEVIDRTNPNKKWDWWQVGGRWSGLLKLKQGAELRGIGSPGLMGSRFADGEDRADQALKRDIDWDGMRADAEAEAAADFDKVHAIIAGREFMRWDDVRKQHEDINEARNVYWAQPVLQDIREAKFGPFFSVEHYMVPREKHLERERDRAGTTFAVLMDGKWYQKGDMGWWGIVSNGMDLEEWSKKFHELIASLPDDTLMTVVDCHI